MEEKEKHFVACTVYEQHVYEMPDENSTRPTNQDRCQTLVNLETISHH